MRPVLQLNSRNRNAPVLNLQYPRAAGKRKVVPVFPSLTRPVQAVEDGDHPPLPDARAAAMRRPTQTTQNGMLMRKMSEA